MGKMKHFWLAILLISSDDISVVSSPRNHPASFKDDQPTSKTTAPDAYFRSIKSGSWNDPTSWQSSDDNLNWTASTLFPTSESRGINIRGGHTITQTQNATAKSLLIETGGTLNSNNPNGGYELIIEDDGTEDADLNVFGTYILYGTKPTLTGNATATIHKGGIIRVDNNSNPANSDQFASDGNVFFNHRSIFEWNTSLSFKTSGTIYFANAHPDTIPIFRISREVTVGSTGNNTFNGLLQVNAKTKFSNNSKKIFRNGVCGSDSLIAINNDVEFVINGNSAVLGGSALKIKTLEKNIQLLTSVLIPRDSSVVIVSRNLNNSNTGNILTIRGTLDMAGNILSNNSGGVVIENTGTYRTKHSGGFSGTNSSLVSGNVNLKVGSTIELYADGDQNLNSRSDFSNIILGGSGIKTPSGPFDPFGTVTIQDDAVFDCSGKNVGNNNTHLKMTGGRLKVSNTLTQPSMAGVYDLTGGVIEFANNSITYQSIRNAEYFNIEVTGKNVQNSDGNIIIRPGGSFIVKPAGSFTINTNSIKGVDNSARVILESGSTFKCGNNQGFNGFESQLYNYSSLHANIKNITLYPGSTIEYVRAGDQRITNADGLEYQNLILSGDGKKTAPPTTLVIRENFSKKADCEFFHNSGTVEFNGEQSQQFFSTSPYPVFFDLVNNNTSKLIVANEFAIKNRLTLGNNSRLMLTANVTLRSDNEGTAAIDKIPEGSASAFIEYEGGVFIVERHIPKHPKAWQLLTAPTVGSTIFESWQNSKINTAGRGVTITDNKANWSENGFDAFSQGGQSMKFYDPVSGKLTGVSKTSDSIHKHPGYFIFIRGDRNVAFGEEPTEVTLHTSGKIYGPPNAGLPPPVITVPPNSFAVVGNPYASAINYDQLSLSENLQYDYYIWDPRLTTDYSAYGLGAYQTISGNTATPGGGQYIDDHIPPIQSGQAFFVFNPSNEPGLISFEENAKTSGSVSIFKNQKGISSPKARIKTNLSTFIDGKKLLLDGTLQLFDKEYSDEINRLDAKKFMNSSENIFLPSSLYNLSIERRSLPSLSDSFRLNITGMNKRTYSLDISMQGISELKLEGMLHDNYTGQIRPLKEGANEYPFIVENDHASYDLNRFFITFKKISSPFHFLNENIMFEDQSVLLQWETRNQEGVKYFIIEYSSDSVHFQRSGQLHVDKNLKTYTWYHQPTEGGIHFFRVTAIMTNGSSVTSKTIKAHIRFPAPGITLYPNPADEKVRMKMVSLPPGVYHARLSQMDGKQVMESVIHHSGTSRYYDISLLHLSSGVYHLEVLYPDGGKKIKRLIISK